MTEQKPRIDKIPDHVNLTAIRDKWIAVGLCTEPTDRARAEAGVAAVYKEAGLNPPKHVFWCKSPAAGVIAQAIVKDHWEKYEAFLKDPEKNTNPFEDKELHAKLDLKNWWDDRLGGNLWVGWLSFYDAMLQIGVEESARLHGHFEIAQSCGWWWAFEDAAVMCDRQNEIHRDLQNRLHNPAGPAIGWSDGFGCYVWHGTLVPREWIEDKANLDPATALTHPNLELRRCAAEILGWDKVIDKLNPKTIQVDPDPEIGTLLEVELPEVGLARFLKVRCGTGRTFVLSVPREMQTALEANAWTYDIDGDTLKKMEFRT